MKPSSMVTAALTGLAVYFLLQFVFGAYGVVAYSVVSDYLDRSRDALTQAQGQQLVFQREIDSLTMDSERILVEARAIGIVGDNEVVVRINGRPRTPVYRYDPGALPTDVPWPRDNRPLFRSIGLAASLLILLLHLLSAPAPERMPRGLRDEEWEIEIGTR